MDTIKLILDYITGPFGGIVVAILVLYGLYKIGKMVVDKLGTKVIEWIDKQSDMIDKIVAAQSSIADTLDKLNVKMDKMEARVANMEDFLLNKESSLKSHPYFSKKKTAEE